MSRRVIALCGGGRWSHVLYDVLGRLLDPEDCVLWQARRGGAAIAERLASHRDPHAARTLHVKTMEELWPHRPTAAIIANAPQMHAKSAAYALERGIPVFVEKPLACSSNEVEALMALAVRGAVPLGVNLEFLYAEYLHALARHFPKQAIRSIDISWHDPERETRSNTIKQADLVTHRLLDIFPHLWSILALLTGCLAPRHKTIVADALRPGTLRLELQCNEICACCDLSRRAPSRERRIVLMLHNGQEAIYDFSIEPGQLSIDGVLTLLESDWATSPSPLMASLAGFLSVVEGASAIDWPLDARRCAGHLIPIPDMIEDANEAEAGLLAQLMRVEESGISWRISALLIDSLLPELAAGGKFCDAREIAGDADALRDMLETALLVIGEKNSDISKARFGYALARSSFLMRVVRHLATSP